MQVAVLGHPIYDWGRDWLLKHHGPEYPTNHVVLIKLQSAEPLMSPAYTFGGRKEEELRATYRKIYGLIPTGHENSAGGSSNSVSTSSSDVELRRPRGCWAL